MGENNVDIGETESASRWIDCLYENMNNARCAQSDCKYCLLKSINNLEVIEAEYTSGWVNYICENINNLELM